jgi:hypothetical protein
MRVKVGKKWYDGKKQFIMIELSDFDRKNISAMPRSNKKYAEFPDGTPIDKKMSDFMEVPLKVLGQPKGEKK